jgi:polyisoprenoid-binding protein YceI
MLRFTFSLVIALSITLCLVWTTSPEVVFPGTAPGSITFIGNAGSDQVFTVNTWKFEEISGLEDPTNIKAVAVLDMTSITCEWKDLEKSLHKKKDYFHSKKFNTATIMIEGAEATEEDGKYTANGQVSIKGVTREIPIEFTLMGEGPYQLEATASINRRKFKFTGGGPKDIVPVTVSATVP